MNSFIYASSPGRSLDGVNCRFLRVIPGGKLRQLCEMAADDLVSVQGLRIVYFLAGIPDICSLKRDRKTKYEENFLDISKDHVKLYKENLTSIYVKCSVWGVRLFIVL